MDIKEAMEARGSNEVYIKGQDEYVPQAVEKMREIILQRAEQTLKELKAKVGIGYSDQSWRELKNISEPRIYAATIADLAAVEAIENFIEDIEDGYMDDDLEDYLSIWKITSLPANLA